MSNPKTNMTIDTELLTEMRADEAHYRRAANRVVAAAKEIVEAGQGFGRKAYLADVATAVGSSVQRLAPLLVAWNALGWVELARADLAANPAKEAASEVGLGRASFHFLRV